MVGADELHLRTDAPKAVRNHGDELATSIWRSSTASRLYQEGWFPGQRSFSIRALQPNFLGQRIGSSFLVNATFSTRTFAHGSAFLRKLLQLAGPELGDADRTRSRGRQQRFKTGAHGASGLTYRRSFERKSAVK